jgi:hypothetical protein
MHIFGPILAAGLMPYLMRSVQCNDAASHHPVSNIIHRRTDENATHSTIHPSAFADYEFRPSNASATPGNNTIQGPPQTIDFVTRTYGLRDSESFYWGIGKLQSTLAQTTP